MKLGRLLAVLAVVLLVVAGLGRRVLEPRRGYFWEHLPRASVWLGEVPCDYYNNQMERWECSHFDNDWAMTGRPLHPRLTFQGKSEDVLLLHPHGSGKERKLEYADVPLGKALRLRYGLADLARSGVLVHFKVLVDGQVVHEEDVREKKLVVREVDTSAFAGKRGTVAFVTTSPAPEGCAFGIDGSPVY